MGFCSSVVVFSVANRVGIFSLLALGIGCQMPQPGLGNRFVAHVASMDSSGLAPSTRYNNLNVQGGIPEGWEAMTTQSTSIYTHQQWRAAGHATGVGIAYIHMPLPMSAKVLIWFARKRYSQQNEKDHKYDPRITAQWTDSLGREWLDAENEKYHVKGYVLTSGFDAWVVYAGYRVHGSPKAADIRVAFRCMDSIVPLPMEKENAMIGSAVGGNW